MSADTIPNEASAWEYDTQIFDGSWHSVVTREHPDILGNTYRNLQPLLADRSTRSAEPAGCMCRDVAFGSHKIAVLMKLPAHMQAEEQARIEAGLSPWITVDACLVEEVNDLWAKGIRTTGCCCGHNKAVGYIGVNEDDILAMKGLGYIVRENTSRPGAQDGFVPKSIKYGDRPAEPAAPVAEVKAWLLGDPATGQWIEVDGHRVEYSRGMGTPAHVLASAFQAERARADELRRLLTASGRCVDDLTARLDASEHAEEVARDVGFNHALSILEDALGSPTYYAADGSETWEGDTRGTIYNLLRASGVWRGDDDMLVTKDRDFWKERFKVESRSRIEAEQRAADALARAEKAERERDAYHDALTPDGDTKALMIGEFFEEIEVRNPDYDDESLDEDEDDEPEFITHRVPVSWTTTKAMMERLRSYAHRLAASREAQPATDGGDNG